MPSKTPKEKDDPPKNKSVGVRIKMSSYNLLREIVSESVAKNPLLRGSYTPENLIRALVDKYLIEQGKLKDVKS